MFETKNGREINIKKLSANEVVNLLKSLQPELSSMLELCNVDDFPFYKATYTFGSQIINSGKCYLPLQNGQSISLNSENLPEELAHDLAYDPLTEDPLAMIVTKNSEFYLPMGDNVIPHAIIRPGEMFGIPRAVNSKADSSLMWNLNAGAHHLFTLSKVTSRFKHNRLQQSYGIVSEVAKTSEDQWRIFVELARAANSPWSSEVLFFSQRLIRHLKTSDSGNILNCLQNIRRNSYNIWHNNSLSWDAAFNTIEHAKHLYFYSSYALSTSRQLYLIAANSAPGFRPATNDDSAPIQLFQDIYDKDYGLKEEKYSSVIMEIADYKPNCSEAIYYSVNFPTLARHNPETFKGKTLLSLMGDVEKITRASQEYIQLMQPKIKSLYDVSATTQFSFFHTHSDSVNYKNIVSPEFIAKQDVRFTQNQAGRFAAHSQFFMGCIKIEPKKAPTE